MNSAWLKGHIDRFIAFLLRPRHLGVKLVTAGVTLLIALSGGFALELKGFAGVVDTLKFSSGEGLPGYLVATAAWLGVAMVVIGTVMMVMTYRREWREADARRVMVVELRGLVDTSDSPLQQALPATLPGRRIDCHVDVRQLLSAKPPQVEEALQELAHIRRQLRLQRGDTTKANVTVVAGGVMHVPLQLYAGTLLEDEGAVQLYDWDRTAKRWKTLDEADDGSRFAVTGLDAVGGSSEVVLAVSATYEVAFKDIAATFPGLPLVHMARPNPLPNALWSEENQAALAQQFLQTLAALGNRGVETVHLVLAASSSLSIRFGMNYDGRNMPQLRCYQHQTGQTPPYPWSVRMANGELPAAYLPTPVRHPDPALTS